MEIRGFRDILKLELEERIAANPAYSLRAMARQAKLSPSMLSALLNGKKSLSDDRAFEVAQSLKFDRKRREHFLLLVRLDRTKSADQRAEILDKLESLAPKRKKTVLENDAFHLISDWYHLPLLELTKTDGFELTAVNAAAALEIPVTTAAAAIERLQRLGLLKEERGRLVKKGGELLAGSPTPNAALRRFHRQMLEKAIGAVHSQTPDERFVGSETFAFSEEDLAKANEIIEDCFSRMIRLSASGRSHRQVYHLGIQLFRLTKGTP